MFNQFLINHAKKAPRQQFPFTERFHLRDDLEKIIYKVLSNFLVPNIVFSNFLNVDISTLFSPSFERNEMILL